MSGQGFATASGLVVPLSGTAGGPAPSTNEVLALIRAFAGFLFAPELIAAQLVERYGPQVVTALRTAIQNGENAAGADLNAVYKATQNIILAL